MNYNISKAQRECIARHDVMVTCMYCGYKRQERLKPCCYYHQENPESHLDCPKQKNYEPRI